MLVEEYLNKLSATKIYQEHLVNTQRIEVSLFSSPIEANSNEHIVVMKVGKNNDSLDFFMTLTPQNRGLPFRNRIFSDQFLLIKVNIRPHQQLTFPQITLPLSSTPNDEMYVSITLDYQIFDAENLIVNHLSALEQLETFTRDRVKHHLSKLDWIEFDLSRSEEPSIEQIKYLLHRDLENYAHKLGLQINEITVSIDLSPVRRQVMNDEMRKRKKREDLSEFVQDMNRIVKDLEKSGLNPAVIDDIRNRLVKNLENRFNIGDLPLENTPLLLPDPQFDPARPVCSKCGTIGRPNSRFCNKCGHQMA